MRKVLEMGPWVVYMRLEHGKTNAVAAICEQAEWDEMERSRPGYHRLIRAGIGSEAEAERVARDNQVAPAVPAGRRK